MACVVNSGNEPPFLGTNNIDLKISVEKNSEINLDLDINWVTVHISLSADYQNYDGPTTGYFFFDSQEFEKSGELVNKTFTVNWNETFWPVTTTCTGSIEIHLDTASISGGYKITNFLISEINSSVYSYKGDIRTRKKEIKRIW